MIDLQTKNKVKCERVSDYLGSGGVKSILNSYSCGKTFNDKIINRDTFPDSKNTLHENKHDYKRFNHYFEGKIGCFMK